MAKRKPRKRTKRRNSKRRKTLNRKTFKIKLKKGVIQSIAALISLSIAILTAFSFTSKTPFLQNLNKFLYHFLGWTSIFIPFFIFIIGLILSNFSLAITQPHVLVGTLLLIISFSGLTQAGNLGQEIHSNLNTLITPTGSTIILISSVTIGALVLFNIGFDQLFIFIFKLLNQLRNILETIIKLQRPKSSNIEFASTQLTINQSGAYSKPETETDPNTNIEKKVLPLPSANQPQPQAVDTIPSSETNQTEMPTLNSNPPDQIWELPPLTLLNNKISGKANRGNLKQNADTIEKTLESFHVNAKVVEVNPGPAVTQYALKVSQGTKLSKITSLTSNLAMALAAKTGQIRIEAPIPGRNLIGIELPNASAEFVGLKTMLESPVMKKQPALTLSLGLDVGGKPKALNLTKMPHLLIAGATGSGKSVCINSFITSILFRSSPAEVKLILIDPKRVELTRYNGIPHLLTPVIVDPKKVLSSLKWLTAEMDRRYKLFAEVGARNLTSFNEISGFQALPYITVIVDELADIMLFAPSEVEDLICRLAQMARATGIHLIVATQRPSVDVLTGLIKANIPARIAFAVSSMTDSRVILDTPGAEKLLGQGDMLFLPPDQAKPTRIQGSLITDAEVMRLIEYIKKQGIPVQYTEEITSTPTGKINSGIGKGSTSAADEEKDPLFKDALRLMTSENASASLLQRKLSIGYARAARILDQMEKEALVGPSEGSKPREINLKAISEYLVNHPS